LPEPRKRCKVHFVEEQWARKFSLLVILILLAAAYSLAVVALHLRTGNSRLDGAIGVVLGLYICSRPAANFVDMLLFWRSSRPPGWSRRTLLSWLVLNLLALAAGYIVIVVGATRFTAPG
jgi:hypothetical protein